MASLQTLRNKGGVIVAVVIGLALLAFVLGDMLTSSSTLFGNSKNNVGEINGQSISAQEYGAKVEYLTTIQSISTGSESNTPEQQEQLREQAWETFVRMYAFLPSIEKLGLDVTKDELSSLFYGSNPSPMVMQMFTNPQTGMFDREYMRSFVQNLDQDKTGRLQMFWSYMQTEVGEQQAMMKFRSLVDKGAYVTSFEADILAKLSSATYNVRFVADRYSSMADSTVSITNSEVRDYYDKHKNMFKTQPNRDIEYVVFDALPSSADYAAADKYISSLAADMATAEDPLAFARANSQGQLVARFFGRSELSGDMAEFAFSASDTALYGPVLNGDEYTVARIAGKATLPDTISLSHIVLEASQTALADSLMKVLAGKDANFGQLAMQYSLDQQSAAMQGKIGDMDPQTLQETFSKELLNAPKGAIKKIVTPQTIHIMKVDDVRGVSPKVQLAMVNYTVEPSEITRGEAYSRANKFLSTVSGSRDKFVQTVADSSLARRTATVQPNQRAVQGIADSREMVSWAYNNGEKEQVSKVMTFGDSFVVTSLAGISEKGIAPLEKVLKEVEAMVRQQKKGELMVQRMAGATSVDELSSKLSLGVIEASDVDFNTFIAPQVGMDPAFAGGVCGMDSTKISKPIVGSLGVYAVQIVGQTANPVLGAVERQRLEAESQQSAFMRSYAAFMELSDVTDLRYRFY